MLKVEEICTIFLFQNCIVTVIFHLVTDISNQIISNKLLNLYQYAKNWADSLTGSWDMANLRILQSDWSKAFRSITQKTQFFKLRAGT